MRRRSPSPGRRHPRPIRRPFARALACALPALAGATLLADDLPAQPARASGARFVSAGVGLARVDERNGIAATIGVSFRRGPIVATLSPIDILILPKWDGDHESRDGRCRNTATGNLVEQTLCDARAEYGASADAGALLGSGATRVWLGGGYLAGTAKTAYGGVTTLLRWGDETHVQLRLRSGDRYVHGSVGFGSPF